MKRLLKSLPEWWWALLTFFVLVVANGIAGGVTGR